MNTLKMRTSVTRTIVLGLVRGLCALMLLGVLVGTAVLLYVIAVSVGGGLVGALAFVCLAYPVFMAASHSLEFLGDGLVADLDEAPQPCQRCGVAKGFAGWAPVDGVCELCTTEEEQLDAAVRPLLKRMDPQMREKCERYLGRRN